MQYSKFSCSEVLLFFFAWYSPMDETKFVRKTRSNGLALLRNITVLDNFESSNAKLPPNKVDFDKKD